MTGIKAVIFDMDGIIIDSEPLWEKTEKLLLYKRGLKYNQEYRDKILGLNQGDSAKLLKETFLLNETVEQLIDERIEILLDFCRKELVLISGIKNLINELSSKNYKIGLASSSPKKFINYVLKKFSLVDYFSVIVSGECTNLGKPEPDIYLEVCKKLKLSPRMCVAVEDSINGVLSAKSAGLYCIAVPDKRLKEEGYKSADKIVDKVSNIEVDTIKELVL